MSPAARCTVCGRPPIAFFEVSMCGEVTCETHGRVSACVACNRPRTLLEPSDWQCLGHEKWRCPTCAIGAVDSQDDVRQLLPRVRRSVAELGFSLCHRVRVRLAEPDELRSLSGTDLLGLTKIAVFDEPRGHADAVLVLRGLPAELFGSTVAHELGHAWLSENGDRPRNPAVEEGLCELIAYAWLKKSSTRFGAALREELAANTDPVYGEGFRQVHTSVRRHGIERVLRTVAATGELPPA